MEFALRSSNLPILNGTLLTVHLKSTIKQKDNKTPLIQVIDISGSMGCVPCVKKQHHQGCTADNSADCTPIAALNNCLIKNPPPNLVSKNVIRILFNQQAVIQKDTKEIMIAGGGTNFAEAFRSLNNVIKQNNVTNGHILFLTDGQDNSNCKEILKTLKETLHSYETILHLIGYGQNHDIGLMETIVKTLVTATFDFAKNPNELENIINGYADVINFTPLTCTITGNDIKEEFIIVPNQSVKVFVKNQNIPEEMNISYSDSETGDIVTIPCNTIFRNNTSEIQTTLEYIDSKVQSLKELSNNMNSVSLSKEIEIVRELLNKSGLHITKEKKNRTTLFSFIEEIRKDINSITSIGLTNLGSQDVMARAVNLASKHGMKQGFQNKLARRLLKNNDDSIVLDIRKEAKSLPQNQEETYGDVDPYEYTDIWSTENWNDILYNNIASDCDGDALCICLQVARPSGVTVVDSSQIKIIDVAFEQCISWQSFISLYKLGLAKDETGESVVGGFDFNTAVESGILKNMRMVKACNAVFPLYITKENWNVAGKYVMKWALGHMACMDPRGFSYEQIATIPFKILEFMERKAHNERTELYNKILEQIKLVCAQCMSEDMIKKTNGCVDDLINDKLSRETCPNLEVLVGRSLCSGDTCKLLHNLLSTNVVKLFSEEIRRVSRGKKGFRSGSDNIETLTNIFKIPGIDETLVEEAKNDKTKVTVQKIEAFDVPENMGIDIDLVYEQMAFYRKKVAKFQQQLENNFGLVNLTKSQLVSIITWGIYNSSNNVSVSFSEQFNPIDDPEKCINNILSVCWKYNRTTLCTQIKNILICNINCASVKDYCNSETVVPPFATVDCDTGEVTMIMSHLHGGSVFGRFLREARCYAGKIVNGPAKLEFLEKRLGWYSGYKGGFCFIV